MSDLRITLRAHGAASNYNPNNFNGGEDVTAKYKIKSIHVERQVNKISTLRIVFVDDEPSAGGGKWYELGKQIYLDVTQKEAQLRFYGIVTKVSTHRDDEGQLFTVIVKHPAYRYVNRLRSCTHASSKQDGWRLVQNYVSDWDFLVTMADLHRRMVVAHDDKLYFLSIGEDNSPKYDLKLDDDIFVSADPGLRERNQPYFISYNSGGPASEENIDGNVELNITAVEGSTLISISSEYDTTASYQSFGAVSLLNIVGENIAGVDLTLLDAVGKNHHDLFIPWTPYSAKTTPEERAKEHKTLMKKFLEAKAWRAQWSFSQGTLRYGNNSIKDLGGYAEADDGKCIYLGQLIDSDSILHYLPGSPYINKGITRITSIKHEINEDGWFLDIGWGMDPKFHIEAHPDINRPPAFGLIPGVKGIQVGIVTAVETVNQEMITVKLFDESVIKIKKMNPIFGASYSRDNVQANGDNAEKTGWPQYAEGDIVLIDFINGDPNKGVVLGLFSSVSAEQRSDGPKDGAKPDLVKPLIGGGDGDGDDSIASEEDVSFSISEEP